MPVASTPRFSTDFDRPLTGLEAPAVLISGSHPSVRIVEGFARGVGIVGRFTAANGMLAIKLATNGQPVRVEVVLRQDQESAAWLSRRAPADEERTPGDVRLVLLHSQGAVRGAALLSRRPGSRRPARASIVFILSPQELPDDGLLVLDMRSIPDDLLPKNAGFASHAVRGLAVTRIEVTHAVPAVTARQTELVLDAASCLRHGVLSTGDLPEVDVSGRRPLPFNVFALNLSSVGPGTDERAMVELRLAARLSTKAEALLPAPLVRVVDGGPVGRARGKAKRLRTKLLPLRAAAVRELRRELKMPRLAAVVERTTRSRVAEPNGVLAKLLAADALRVDVVGLSDGAPVSVSSSVKKFQLVLRMPLTHTPMLTRVGSQAGVNADLLQGRSLIWSVVSATFTHDVEEPVQPEGSRA